MNTKMKEALSILERGEIPSSFAGLDLSGWKNFEESLRFRDEYSNKYGFALIDMEWNKILVEKIIKDSKCLEIMAGTGMWSQALRDLGVDIVCTDNLSWENETKGEWKKHRTEIIGMDAIQAIETYGKDVSFILMSWPYMDETANECLMKMREVNQNARMLYIGEGEGGCTASDSFFENMELIDIPDIDLVNQHFTSFIGIHDRIRMIK